MARDAIPLTPIPPDPEPDGRELRGVIERLFRRSLYMRHVDAGSCDGCESELKQLTSPYYDLHRLGIFFATSPRHADLLLVTGSVTRAMEAPLLRTYEAMPDPRLVVAVGACACHGGVYGASSLTRGGLAAVLPVDCFIPGCPPTPLALIQGLLLAVGRIEQKLHQGRLTPVGEEGGGFTSNGHRGQPSMSSNGKEVMSQ